MSEFAMKNAKMRFKIIEETKKLWYSIITVFLYKIVFRALKN